MPHPERLGFLDLPAEIRLQIYPYLLHASRSWRRKYAPQPYTSSFRTPCTIECSRKGADPHTLRYNRTFSDYSSDDPLYPLVLATCRTVHEEATPILYQENTFCFWTDHIDLEFDHLSRDAKRVCQDLMSYTIDGDTNEDVSKSIKLYSDVPSPVNESTFAAFLRRIGPYNASLIRGLKLTCWNPYQAADDVVLATQLCYFHMPSLQSLKLCVFEKEGIHWEESPDYFHPDWSSPFWCNGPSNPMYRALQRFVDKLVWLRELEYDLGEGMQFRFEDPHAMSKIHELQDAVKARAAEAKTEEGMEQNGGMEVLLSGLKIGGVEA
ncbi:MAG: hypothetical protein LQ337_005585 [Flavoplaca oasis]|nr:MAG: hypothetical protein LQ337_005585 [Flavoplaca oasis]